MPRREFIRLLGVVGAAAGVAGPFLAESSASAQAAGSRFPDGIKSGDPQPRSAVIWTRIGPTDQTLPPASVVWSVAEDAAMNDVVRGGAVQVDASTGFNLHVRVDRLQPDRWYHYRFEVDGQHSVVGRLRTAPKPNAQADHLRYAFASCQQRNASYYVAHRAIANEDIDFLMHLGDYIYVHDTATLSVDDYRGVYHRFHSDPELQAMHAAVPLVAVWDDGEFYNGVDRTGDPQRLANARQAWFEAMPLLQGKERDRTYRRLRWGRLADFYLLDTRQYRDPEVPANSTFADLLDAQDTTLPGGDEMLAPGRTTLGGAQKRWLTEGLRPKQGDVEGPRQ